MKSLWIISRSTERIIHSACCEVRAMSVACVWTCVVLLATTPGIIVFASPAFIVDTPNGTVHVDPSGLTVSTADNPTGEYPCLWYSVVVVAWWQCKIMNGRRKSN